MAPLLGLADAEAEAAAAALEWLPLAGAALSEAEAAPAEGAALDASALGEVAPAEGMPWLFVEPPRATLEQIWPYTPLAMTCESRSLQSLLVSRCCDDGPANRTRRECYDERGSQVRHLVRRGWAGKR